MRHILNKLLSGGSATWRDLASVEALATRWNKTGRALDILVNNVGTAPGTDKVVLTKDRFEICHQVNFLLHMHLMLNLLLLVVKVHSL